MKSEQSVELRRGFAPDSANSWRIHQRSVPCSPVPCAWVGVSLWSILLPKVDHTVTAVERSQFYRAAVQLLFLPVALQLLTAAVGDTGLPTASRSVWCWPSDLIRSWKDALNAVWTEHVLTDCWEVFFFFGWDFQTDLMWKLVFLRKLKDVLGTCYP